MRFTFIFSIRAAQSDTNRVLLTEMRDLKVYKVSHYLMTNFILIVSKVAGLNN